MLNIVIPMAGRGKRFADAGYVLPKPLIDVKGKPMIQVVTENIRPTQEHQFIYICQSDHIKKYDLDTKLREMSSNCIIVSIDHVTEGAACTVLLAEEYINNNNALMIANSDQYVDVDINEYLAVKEDSDGLIMCMPADDPKWSFIKYDENGYVTMVREKEVISSEATVGIYNYKYGRDFVNYAKLMISKDVRVNGEFYVAPVYNEMIADGKKIIYKDIGENMHGLGTPEDLVEFLKRK
ncbi:glycosyltransferase family 2 protein [Selenomonas ruminantium]|uniref:glycosyltransferase family 2 protein n=1 Tax=Selenomonas ruminantium TaxID=971 RepID=UPI0026F3506B|nr:glycosyltransferase family 2 protein [Selenomonas ruminantium]